MSRTSSAPVEIYGYDGPGYRPLFAGEGWLVAWLNFLPAAEAGNVTDLERHERTDEAFVLVQGEADLVTKTEDSLWFTVMEKNRVYLVRRGVWHGLVMQERAQLVIIRNQDLSDKKDVPT